MIVVEVFNAAGSHGFHEFHIDMLASESVHNFQQNLAHRHISLIQANHDKCALGCSLDFQLPFGLGYFDDGAEARFCSLLFHFLQALLSVLLKELIIIIKIDIILRLLLQLLRVHDFLVIIVLKLLDILRENFLRGRLLGQRLVIAHFDLNVIPLSCHSVHHIYLTKELFFFIYD